MTPRGAGAAGLALAALLACQGEGRAPKAEGASGASGSAAGAAGPGAAAAGSSGADGAGGSADGEAAPASAPSAPSAPLTGAQIIAKLGAISAWEGVVQRGQYLERSGQRGALYGRVGDKPAGDDGDHAWLLDDTEGEGCLAARVVFPDGAPPAGSRVVVSGAWRLQTPPIPPTAPIPPTVPAEPPPAAPAVAAAAAPPIWVWKAERVAALPDEGAAFSPTSPVGHDLKSGARPAEAVPISQAKDNDLVVFQVLAAPRRLGEAWLVGDQLGSPPVAMLSMPGDRASYGGIDFRQPDEQWRLRRGATYVVRIGKIRRKDPSKPATINARNAPIKL